MDTLDAELATAYLARIGVARPDRPGVAALRALQLRHLRSVPFENLSIHLGEDILLTGPALAEKVARAGRGGFCYEVNGAFAALLTTLGYRVTRLAARVFDAEGRLGPPYDHLALCVEAVDSPDRWLVDVGFGRLSTRPLRLDDRASQVDEAGLFRVVETPQGDLDVLGDGLPAYRLEPRPRALADFEATCWWHRTSPASIFTRSLICSMRTPTGRVTLSGRVLTVTDAQGRRREERLPDASAVLDAYRRHFGIALEREPRVIRHGPAPVPDGADGLSGR